MKTIVVGLFPSQIAAKKISEMLENSGFSNENYIIYKTDAHKTDAHKISFWQKLFSPKKEDHPIDEDKLIISAEATTEERLQTVKTIFNGESPIKIYEFQDMSIEEAKSLDYIKKIVELRAKTEIYAMPDISTSHGDMNTGINSEVKA